MAVEQSVKAEPFTNRQDIPLKVGSLEGTVTIPVILDDVDLGTYLKFINSYDDDKEKENRILTDQIRRRLESIRHMVKGIDFPGLSMTNFKKTGKPPYPAVVHQIGDALDPLIRDALNLPNS